jgi:hypothetical protein
MAITTAMSTPITRPAAASAMRARRNGFTHAIVAPGGGTPVERRRACLDPDSGGPDNDFTNRNTTEPGLSLTPRL